MTNEEIEEAFGTFFPTDVTDVPLFPGEDAEWFCYGHIESQRFIDAVEAGIEYLCQDGEDYGVQDCKDDVIQGYAYLINDDIDELRFVFCASDHEGAFPLTRIVF